VAQNEKKSLNRVHIFVLRIGRHGYKKFYTDFKMGLFNFVCSWTLLSNFFLFFGPQKLISAAEDMKIKKNALST
jgi:hypothetical protein